MVRLSMQCVFYTNMHLAVFRQEINPVNRSRIYGKKHILACVHTHVQIHLPTHTQRQMYMLLHTQMSVRAEIFLETERQRRDIFIALRWILNRLVPFI